MRKSWKINRGRTTATLIFSFYLLCCLLILADPAVPQLGVGAQFGVIILTITFVAGFLFASVAEEKEEENPDRS